MLVVELRNSNIGMERQVSFPEGFTAVTLEDRVWVNIFDEKKNKAAAFRSDEVVGVFHADMNFNPTSAPQSKIPVDTRLNHTMMKRASNGRFVGKK